ncbi:MAG: ATP-binding protein, partial [Cyanobacteria bacterium J06626_14]
IALCIAGLVGTLGAAFAVHLFYQLERELVDRENNLRQTNQRLEVVCDQLQRFTANASHELRAPLAAVLSNAQVGLMDLEDWDSAPLPLRKKLTKIVDLTKRMSRLVSDLLFLARHEGLLASENLRRVELNGLVRGLADDWKLEAEAHQLKLDSQQPDTSIFVSADVNLLRQAIANLLSNACRYTPPGGTIHFNLMPSQNQQAIILVQDTGIGIPSEAIPHLFERFYRVDPKRSKASGGLGLGLAIAQQVIQAHRGQIRVHSSVGEGTTFQITLPVATIDLQFDSASIDETISLSPPVTLDAASTVGHSSSINRI